MADKINDRREQMSEEQLDAVTGGQAESIKPRKEMIAGSIGGRKELIVGGLEEMQRIAQIPNVPFESDGQLPNVPFESDGLNGIKEAPPIMKVSRPIKQLKEVPFDPLRELP